MHYFPTVPAGHVIFGAVKLNHEKSKCILLTGVVVEANEAVAIATIRTLKYVLHIGRYRMPVPQTLFDKRQLVKSGRSTMLVSAINNVIRTRMQVQDKLVVRSLGGISATTPIF